MDLIFFTEIPLIDLTLNEIESDVATRKPKHTVEKSFQCKVCTKKFTTKGILKTHMRTHQVQHGTKSKKAKESHKKDCGSKSV